MAKKRRTLPMEHLSAEQQAAVRQQLDQTKRRETGGTFVAPRKSPDAALKQAERFLNEQPAPKKRRGEPSNRDPRRERDVAVVAREVGRRGRGPAPA